MAFPFYAFHLALRLALRQLRVARPLPRLLAHALRPHQLQLHVVDLGLLRRHLELQRLECRLYLRASRAPFMNDSSCTTR
jgi:hypothetical protein